MRFLQSSYILHAVFILKVNLKCPVGPEGKGEQIQLKTNNRDVEFEKSCCNIGSSEPCIRFVAFRKEGFSNIN